MTLCDHRVMDNQGSNLSNGLVIAVSIPFHWHDRALADCQSAQATNHVVYNLLEGNEEKGVTRAAAQQPSHPELAPIEAKLNLVLQLLTQVIQQQNPLPSKLFVELSATQLAWQIATGVAQHVIPAQYLELILHLDPRVPLPITLCGRVVSVAADGRVCVQLQHHGAAEADAWERWLFRQHRRMVAHSRHGGPI